MRKHPQKIISDNVMIKVIEPGNLNLEQQPPNTPIQPMLKKETVDRKIPSWIVYYLDIAEAVAQRSSCLRRQVGCVVVKDKQVLATGYNGAPCGRRSCIDWGFCYRDKKNIASGTEIEKCLSIGSHAEINSITHAAKHGIAVKGADMFLVGHWFVCEMCKSAIINAGIDKVYMRNPDNRIITVIEVSSWGRHSLEADNPDLYKCNC